MMFKSMQSYNTKSGSNAMGFACAASQSDFACLILDAVIAASIFVVLGLVLSLIIEVVEVISIVLAVVAIIISLLIIAKLSTDRPDSVMVH